MPCSHVSAGLRDSAVRTGDQRLEGKNVIRYRWTIRLRWDGFGENFGGRQPQEVTTGVDVPEMVKIITTAASIPKKRSQIFAV